MDITQKTDILFRLGKILEQISDKKAWSGYDLGINEEEYNSLVALTKSAKHYNGWFTEESILKSFKGISSWLSPNKIEAFIQNYDVQNTKTKNVAIIMAGNIPLVGFHDFLMTFLSGHKSIIKLSSSDDKLFPALLKIMSLFNEEMKEYVTIAESKLEDFNAVIATGSDNSANQFLSYFDGYPNIIRRNRTSVAVLNGEETLEDLKALGKDIFEFYGLGCRNVTKIFIPQEFELNRFFEAIFSYGDVINHHKYANNYDYNKAVYMMNMIPILDNNFIILKEDEGLHSPLGVLFYERYTDLNDVEQKLKSIENELQVIIGKGFTEFGKAQHPEIDDFADKIDTMKFLCDLKA